MPNRATPRKDILVIASFDFYFLQNRDYPRERSLEMVGNRYNLTASERNILRRGVFGSKDALTRQGKRTHLASSRYKTLTIDGHNVHITVESALLERLILKGNDGALRDIAEISGSFRLTEVSLFAAELICRFLEPYDIAEVFIYFDAPVSKSGELAKIYNELFRKYGIRGKALTVQVPERSFPYQESIIASSDSAVIDKAYEWIDLASMVINKEKSVRPFIDFSFLHRGYPDNIDL
ncbi:MAG: DUF434 domain-containing protein [Syntrophobacterales bacterium]|nr:DUF434 domain-containing protein [Syntrophobacterales bacterium]